VAIWIAVSVLILTFHRHNLDLDLIGVPETLSKAGFSLSARIVSYPGGKPGDVGLFFSCQGR